jgi:hypothetical protein
MTKLSAAALAEGSENTAVCCELDVLQAQAEGAEVVAEHLRLEDIGDRRRQLA